jgi:cysteine sulfinate desulfinase/cysteine desulfurase-like protein
MHLGDNRVRGSLRFSLGRFNSEDEVERATVIAPTVIEKLRSLSAPASQGTLG